MHPITSSPWQFFFFSVRLVDSAGKFWPEMQETPDMYIYKSFALEAKSFSDSILYGYSATKNGEFYRSCYSVIKEFCMHH